MKKGDLEDDISIIEWLDVLNPRPKTRELYILSMQKYTDFVKMSPTALIEEAEEDIRSGKLPRQRRIKKHIVSFRKHLIDSGLAPFTISGYMTGVRSFYARNDIDLPKLPRNGSRDRPKKEHTKIPSPEDTRDALSSTTHRERAIMLCGLSSGMGANELSELTIMQFKEGYDQETGITMLDLRRGKVVFDFITFLSPEASKAVWEYLEYRDRPCETGCSLTAKQLEKQRTTKDSYLFIAEKIPDTYLETRDEVIRKLAPVAIVKMYKRISNKAGKDTPPGQYNIIRSHNMRKIFNSRLKNAGCDSDLVEYFMGHTLGGTKDAYYRPDIEQLKEIYMRFVPHLLISEEFELKEELKQRDDTQGILMNRIDALEEKMRLYDAREIARLAENEK